MLPPKRIVSRSGRRDRAAHAVERGSQNLNLQPLGGGDHLRVARLAAAGPRIASCCSSRRSGRGGRGRARRRPPRRSRVHLRGRCVPSAGARGTVAREHRVEDDEIGAAAEIDDATPQGGEPLGVLRRRLPQRGRRRDELAVEQDVAERRGVGDVGDRGAVGFDAVGDRRIRMIERRAGHAYAADLELRALVELAKAHVGLQRLERHGEIGRRGLAREDGAQAVVSAQSVDVEAVAGRV